MKTSAAGFFAACAVIFAFIHPASAASSDTNPPPRLTIELRDGSRVIGTSVEKNIEFRSALLGERKLEIKYVRSVEFAATNTAKLTTVNNDILTVALLEPSIPVKTSFGKVELAVESIRKISITTLGKTGSRRAGLVALWAGENDGKDLTGNHDAQIPAGVEFAPAKIGTGFNFGGQPSRVLVPNAEDLNFGPGQDFSIEGWIKVPTLNSSMEQYPASWSGSSIRYSGMKRNYPYLRDGIMTIIDKREAPNSVQCRGYELILWNGRLHLRLSDSLDGIGEGFGPAGPDLRDGKFHHIAVTINRGVADGGKLYVDGKEVLTFNPTIISGDLTTSQPLRIGNHADPSYQCYFNGILDELAIFNRALSADEIREDSQAGD